MHPLAATVLFALGVQGFCSATCILLDDFSTDQIGESLGLYQYIDGEGILGSRRLVYTAESEIIVTDGSAQIRSLRAGHPIELIYQGPVPLGSSQGVLGPLDFSGVGLSLSFDILSTTGSAYITGFGLFTGNPQGGFVLFDVPEGPLPDTGTVLIPFSNSIGSGGDPDLSEVTSIVVSFRTEEDSRLTIDNLRIIPEPAAATLALMAAVTLMLRRRRSQYHLHNRA